MNPSRVQNAKIKKNVVITTPTTLSSSAKTTIAIHTIVVVDFDFELVVQKLWRRLNTIEEVTELTCLLCFPSIIRLPVIYP